MQTKIKSVIPVFFAIINLVLLAGCCRLLTRPPLNADAITIGEIRQRVEQNYAQLSSIKARAKICLEAPQMNLVANSKIYFKKPDSLMINLSAGFGLGVGSIFMDKHQFQLYSSMDNTVYSAKPDSFDLKQFFLINVKFDEIFQAFSGLQLIKFHDSESLSVNANQYLLLGTIQNSVLKYRIDPKKYVVTEFEQSDSTGKTVIKFQYDQFAKSSRVLLPKTIRISQPDQKARITIAISSLSVNEKIDPEEFRLKIPNNTVKISL